jgi:hypothetical protein
MAEVPEAPQSTPADRQLAAAYETLYAAAAALECWAGQPEPGRGDELWLRATLRGLLARLHRLLDEPAPALDAQAAEEALADRIAELAETGAPLTSFAC